jgi:hypothetical protein
LEIVSPPDRKLDQKIPAPPGRKFVAPPEAKIYYALEPILVTPLEPKKFFVTLEEIVCPGSESWKKKDDVLQPVLVVTDLMEDTTVRSFVQKARAAEEKVKEVAKIQRDKTWRVFFPDNLPDPIDWRISIYTRFLYLIDMTGRDDKGNDTTLADIGINEANNRLLYFHQFRFESRDEP